MNSQNKHLVLIIDDEPQIRRLLILTLEANSYRVKEAATGKEGLVAVSMHHPDVVLLDLGLPDMDGLQVLKQLREWSKVPLIILSVRDAEETMIEALDSGADDYVSKPFNTGELLARIRVSMRHSLKLDELPVFSSGGLEVDLINRTVRLEGQEVKLTVMEYSLLALFLKYSGRVLTHTFIIREIWGNPYADNSQILRVHIAQLRKKIEKNPSIPELLITEPGVGYRLKVI
ncbi:MAG: response regulator transcription factor [Bacteroidota bacterium]